MYSLSHILDCFHCKDNQHNKEFFDYKCTKRQFKNRFRGLLSWINNKSHCLINIDYFFLNAILSNLLETMYDKLFLGLYLCTNDPYYNLSILFQFSKLKRIQSTSVTFMSDLVKLRLAVQGNKGNERKGVKINPMSYCNDRYIILSQSQEHSIYWIITYTSHTRTLCS